MFDVMQIFDTGIFQACLLSIVINLQELGSAIFT